jgi:hypothetical protein
LEDRPMNSFHSPDRRVNPDRPADLDPEIIWIEEVPAQPPVAPVKCPSCSALLVVYHGITLCENCTTWMLPDDDEWMGPDNGGHFE